VTAFDISGLLRDHVYTAIILGGLVEGETTVVLAGYAAHQGYVAWWAVASLSALVNFVLDQTWFLLGRWRGERLLARFAFLRRGVAVITPRLHQHRRWLVFSVRFLYGLRTAGPVAMGIARVPWLDFVVFNALGSVVWAGVFTALGYAFGQTITVILGEVVHYEALAVAVIAAGGLVGWLYYRHRRAAIRRAAGG
jgi:membrane protein DedA with SNARE-associated domain